MISIDDKFKFNIGDIIIVACSAGPDSMALLSMLNNIKDKYKLKLIIAHVDHNVRDKSLEEANYVEKVCADNDLTFELLKIEDYSDDNFENEARVKRYRFFDKLVEKYKANYVMTAHHADDLIETILMKIVRGSNLSGYAGFRMIVDMGNYKIVRPLIYYTKDELIKYDEENNIKYYMDATNFDDIHTRNRYRKVILPFLKKENSDVHKKFLKYNEVLLNTSGYIDRIVNKALKNCYSNGIIIDKFIKEDSFIQREILYTIINKYYNDDLFLVSDKHIDLIHDLILSNKSNGYINLPNDIIAKKEYNMLKLEHSANDVVLYDILINDKVVLPNGKVICSVTNENSNSNYVCRLNSREIKLPLSVRSRKVGDKIAVKGLNGRKKVKDIFIDKKIGKTERGLQPIVVDSCGTIVWIPGVIKSKFDKNIDDNYDIMLKYTGGKNEK